MAFVKKDRVRESSTTTGTGAFALAGAVGASQRFSAVMSIGDTCWYAIVLPGSAWETGLGTYSALNTLTRTTVYESSNGGAAVNFTAGTKDVFIALPASQQDFPSGTLMLFQQTAAPLYWTKQTTHNDKALRVVSGAASSGGTNAFSTVMAQTTVGSSTLSQAQLAAHTHTVPIAANNLATTDVTGGNAMNASNTTTSSVGSGASHNHTITMAIQYVDLIIAAKD